MEKIQKDDAARFSSPGRVGCYLVPMLIASISGIRGTVGGKAGEGLSPADVVTFASGYGAWVREQHPAVGRPKVVVGRDARISGPWVRDVVCGTLNALGLDVVRILRGLLHTLSVPLCIFACKVRVFARRLCQAAAARRPHNQLIRASIDGGCGRARGA